MHISRWFQSYFNSICDQVKNGQTSEIANIPKKILARMGRTLHIISNRLKVLRGEQITDCTDVDRMFGCDVIDPLEIKFLNEVSKKYDIEAIFAAFKKFL